MNIQYIKTNIEKLSQQQLISLLADMILETVEDIEQFNSTKVYGIGDKVYLEENGTHCVYQCMMHGTTGNFNKEKWLHLVEVYRGTNPPFYTIRILEEVLKPTTAPIINHTISLNYNVNQSTVALYKGKLRLIRDVDFTLNGKNIVLNKPLQIGERIIIEVRERLGIIPNIVAGIVLYDINEVPYNVIIDDKGLLTINKIDKKDPVRDVKRATIIYGDKIYSLMVDSSVTPVRLNLFEEVKQYIKTTDGSIYGLTVVDKQYTLNKESYVYDGVEVILGTDKNFYNFKVENNRLVPIRSTDSTLKTSDFTLGLKLLNTDYAPRMIDVVNGTLRIVEYEPNVAYNNIMLRSTNGKTYRVTLNAELGLHLHDDPTGIGTHSPLKDVIYFYDYDWNRWKLHLVDERLIFETTGEVQVRDSKGINMISDTGLLCKFMVMANDSVDIIKFADFSKTGTFTAPLNDGLVVMDNGAKKLISVNLNGDRLELKNASANNVHKTNDHYIYGSDNKLYKISYVGSNVTVIECDTNEFIVENKRRKIVMKCNEVINIIDVTSGNINVIPVSTFTHTLQSVDGKKYIMGVTGDKGKEQISLKEITSQHPYYNTVGVGCIYIKNNMDEYYKGVVDASANLRFSKVNFDELINYDIASVAYTENGWYKFEMTGTVLSIRKIFNNVYYPGLCYELSREYVLKSENNKKFSVTTNGSGELLINPTENINIPGIFLRSNDDNVYCLGVVNNAIGTYRSYIEKSVNITKSINVKDIITGRYAMLYMNEDNLVVETIATAPTDSVKELYVYDDYNKEFILYLANGKLLLVENLLYNVRSLSSKKYSMSIDRRKLVFKESTDNNVADYIKMTDLVTGIHYEGYVNDNGILEFKTTTVAHKTFTQAIMTSDGELYILSMSAGKVSMALIGDKTKSFKIDDENDMDYIPQEMENKMIYDMIKIYPDVINTEGYTMMNYYDILDNGDLTEDIDDDRFIYDIPVITRNRPKVTIIEDIDKGDEY